MHIMRSFIIVLFTKYYYGNQIKMNERDGTCSMYGRDKKCVQNSSWRTQREESYLQNPGIYGKIILEWTI
jgi:hypothetical protein